MKDKYILTAESVTAGHPDKLCDTSETRNTAMTKIIGAIASVSNAFCIRTTAAKDTVRISSVSNRSFMQLRNFILSPPI